MYFYNASNSILEKKAYMIQKQGSEHLLFFSKLLERIGGVNRCGVLTRDGAKVEVIPYDLLELVIQ